MRQSKNGASAPVLNQKRGDHGRRETRVASKEFAGDRRDFDEVYSVSRQLLGVSCVVWQNEPKICSNFNSASLLNTLVAAGGRDVSSC
jgi:hypothetical protein